MLEPLFDQLQKSFLNLSDDAVRLFHGRGHCYDELSFINIDWFSPIVWVVVYGEVEQDIIDRISARLCECSEDNDRVKCVSLQRRIKGRAQQDIIYGEMPEKCYAYEEGMRYELNFSTNQNIGFFLDAKPGRQWLREQSKNKRVLNLFAYTCSFSVAAMQGGADSVVNIDMAKSAIATGQRNHALNELDISRVKFLPHDIFRSTRKLENFGSYDLVVIDPPSRQKGSFEAEKDYGRLLAKLKPMLADNAKVLACLNAPYLGEEFLVDLFDEKLPELALVERLPQREDFPEKDLACCLKMQIFGG